ncbi:MAG: hypothetical protein HYW71_01340 [Candidatus Niyogibacteria bacterium]|nr:hypothetical protein [Candidatus Niyogibacteria bacterium]
MPKKITIEDLAEITSKGFKEVSKRIEQIDKKIDDKIDNLAQITARGFEQVDKRFEQVDQRFEQVDQRFEQVDQRFEKIEGNLEHMNARMSNIENDTAEIRRHFVYRHEFEDLMVRVKYLEQKLGIKSGK